jgi:hypothetical protein
MRNKFAGFGSGSISKRPGSGSVPKSHGSTTMRTATCKCFYCFCCYCCYYL